MRNSKGRTPFTIWRKLGISLVAVVCGCVVATGLYFLFHPDFQRLRALKVRIEEIEARIEQLERENEEYAEKMQKLREPPAGDPHYIEKIARQNIGLVREGETVYHMQDSLRR